MTCPLDRLWPPAWPKVGRSLRSFRAVPITRKQDRTEQTKFTVLVPLTYNFGPLGSDFWGQVAPTWAPGLAKPALLLQSGIELHKSPFSKKNNKKLSLRTPGWRPHRPKGGSGPPGTAKQTPRCFKKWHWAFIFLSFSELFARPGPTSSQGCFRRLILTQSDRPDYQKHWKYTHSFWKLNKLFRITKHATQLLSVMHEHFRNITYTLCFHKT